MIKALEPQEKREFQRIPMDVRASVTGEGAFIACSIRNVADDGAKVMLLAKCEHLHIAEGSDICLNVPKYDELCGRVIWVHDEYLGIQFDEHHTMNALLH